MKRKIYISSGEISLAEYLPSDHLDDYNDWRDAETQAGFNSASADTFEKFEQRQIRQRLYASVMLNETGENIGWIGISPEDAPPDLAIRIYRPYRRCGYGAMAFRLGIEYAFSVLRLEKIYAGCYPHNEGSMKIIRGCGFVPHPDGNMLEKHFLTGEDVVQYDFVLYNPVYKEACEVLMDTDISI